MPQEETKHPPAYCIKERQIAEIHTKVERIEKIVMDGNGEEALATCVPKLSDSVEFLNKRTIPNLQKEISGFMKFQNESEGRSEGKESVRKRTKFIIGSLLTVCSLLLVLVGILIGVMQ